MSKQVHPTTVAIKAIASRCRHTPELFGKVSLALHDQHGQVQHTLDCLDSVRTTEAGMRSAFARRDQAIDFVEQVWNTGVQPEYEQVVDYLGERADNRLGTVLQFVWKDFDAADRAALRALAHAVELTAVREPVQAEAEYIGYLMDSEGELEVELREQGLID